MLLVRIHRRCSRFTSLAVSHEGDPLLFLLLLLIIISLHPVTRPEQIYTHEMSSLPPSGSRASEETLQDDLVLKLENNQKDKQKNK